MSHTGPSAFGRGAGRAGSRAPTRSSAHRAGICSFLPSASRPGQHPSHDQQLKLSMGCQLGYDQGFHAQICVPRPTQPSPLATGTVDVVHQSAECRVSSTETGGRAMHLMTRNPRTLKPEVREREGHTEAHFAVRSHSAAMRGREIDSSLSHSSQGVHRNPGRTLWYRQDPRRALCEAAHSGTHRDQAKAP
jgi:hypothetical protein